MRQQFAPILLTAACLWWSSTAAGAAAGTAKRPLQTAPAAPPEYVTTALKAIDANALPAFARSLDEDVGRAVADLKALDLPRVTTTAAFREFGRYFGRIEKLQPAQLSTLRWLVAQPRLMPTLMAAVSDADAPENVLTILDALRREHGDRLNDYPDLTTAVCVVWDAPPETQPAKPGAAAPSSAASAARPPDPRAAAKRFGYYADARNHFPYDMKAMPWQLGVYVVDSAVSDDEVAWAVRAYANRRVMSKIYFEVPYDTRAFHEGRRRLEGDQYTLPNIRQVGGVCLDQAYFAAHVSKALGVPAAVCTGQSGQQGELHAWFGYVQPAGKASAWNFYEGRYAAMLFWTGQVADPQGGPPMTDADVCLLSELTTTPAEKRLASALLCKCRDRAAGGPELFMRAIDLSPGNRIAWMGLAGLGAERQLDVEQINRVTEVVQRFAVERYPDFAFAVYRRIIGGRDLEEQLRAMSRIVQQFSLRPDLVATVQLAKGDLLRDAGRAKEALAAYQEAMGDPARIGPVLPDAMARVDALLRGSDLPRLATIYRTVWSRTPTPQPSGYADVTPFCVIGHRYAALLREMGDVRTATTVEQRLAGFEGKR